MSRARAARRCAVGILLAGPLLFEVSAAAEGVVLEGRDVAEIRLPASALVEDYENVGYSVRVERGVATVTVDLTPLRSRAPFRLRERESGYGEESIRRLAASLVADAATEVEAASRLLGWISRHVRYELDRARPQAPAAVLERRSGYCTGISRLAVAMLSSVGLQAREVAGYVASSRRGGSPRYHRWIEVHFSDRGWVFSDPLRSHHYVPASYVRLASERLLPDPSGDVTTVLAREDGRRPVDVAGEVAAGIGVRRNDQRQRAASLGVVVGSPRPGRAVLRGDGRARQAVLHGGRTDFVGLEPGRYDLVVLVEGQPPLHRRLVFRDRIRAEISIR